MSAQITRDDIDKLYEKVRRQMTKQADEAAVKTHLEKARKQASARVGERVIGEGTEITKDALNRLAWLERVFGDVAGLQSAGVPADKAEFWRAAQRYTTPVGARTFEDIMRRMGVAVPQGGIDVANTEDPRLMFYLNPKMLRKLSEEAKNRDVVERQMERGVFADKPLEHYALLPAAGFGAALSAGRIGPMLALYETGRIASGELGSGQKQQIDKVSEDVLGTVLTAAMASTLGVPVAKLAARTAGKAAVKAVSDAASKTAEKASEIAAKAAASKAGQAISKTQAAKRAAAMMQEYGKRVEPLIEKGRVLREGAKEAAKRAARAGEEAKKAFDEFVSKYVIPASVASYGFSGGIDIPAEVEKQKKAREEKEKERKK